MSDAEFSEYVINKIKFLEDRVEILYEVFVRAILREGVASEHDARLQALLDRAHRKRIATGIARPDPRVPTLEEAKMVHIYDVLNMCKGNKTKTARLLKMDVKTLYATLQRWGYKSGDEMSIGGGEKDQ